MPVLLFRLLRVECIDQWRDPEPDGSQLAEDVEFIAVTEPGHHTHGFYVDHLMVAHRVTGPSRLVEGGTNDVQEIGEVELNPGDQVTVQVPYSVMGGVAELGTVRISREMPITEWTMSGRSGNQMPWPQDVYGDYNYKIHYEVVRIHRPGAPYSAGTPASASADPSLSDETDGQLVIACGQGRMALSHRYTLGAPVAGGRYWVTDTGGTVVYASGTLDHYGRAIVLDLAVPCSELRVLLEDSPNLYAVRQDLRTPNLDLNFDADRIVVTSESALDWLVGCVIGDFNDDQDLGQMGVNLVFGLIPVVDQVLDTRDLYAAVWNLLRNHRQEGGRLEPGYLSGWQWGNLFLCAVGAIPEFGTVVKGVLRIVWRGGREGAAHLLRKVIEGLHHVGYGDVLGLLRRFREGGVDAGRLGRLTLPQVLDWAKDFIRRLLESARQVAEDLGTHARAMWQRLHEAITHLDEMFERFKQAITDRFNAMMDELIPPNYAMAPAGAGGAMGPMHMTAATPPRRPRPSPGHGSTGSTGTRRTHTPEPPAEHLPNAEAEAHVRQTSTPDVLRAAGRGARRLGRRAASEISAVRRIPSELSQKLERWTVAAGMTDAHREFYRSLFREFQQACGDPDAVQWIHEGAVFITREGFIIGPYEVLSRLAQRELGSVGEAREWFQAIGARFGFRESDRVIPAVERRIERIADAPRGPVPDAAEIDRRVGQREAGSPQTPRTGELDPQRGSFWANQTLQAHHLIEDNILDVFGRNTGNFIHELAPNVLLTYEAHQKYLTALFNRGLLEMDVASRRAIQAARGDWPTAHRLLSAALEHWNTRSDDFIRITRMLLRRIAPSGS